MLSACRGSLATCFMQVAAAFRLLLLSWRRETLPPSLPPASPARSQPRPPCPQPPWVIKPRSHSVSLTVVSLLRAVEESSGLENPGSLILALRAGRGDFEAKLEGLLLAGRAGGTGDFTAVAPGGSGDWAGSRLPRAPRVWWQKALVHRLGGLVLCLDSGRHVGCGRKRWHSKWRRRGLGWLEP